MHWSDNLRSMSEKEKRQKCRDRSAGHTFSSGSGKHTVPVKRKVLPPRRSPGCLAGLFLLLGLMFP